MGSYLIAGGYVGYSTTDSTEVIEFVKTNSTLLFGKLPSRRESAVGAMIGNVPILCGGWDAMDIINFDDCISFQNSQWSQSHSMNMKRNYFWSKYFRSALNECLEGWIAMDASSVIARYRLMMM